MSATLDGARVARLLDDCPVVRSEGRAWPVETRYLGRDPAARLEDQAARAVRKALAEETGSILVFLPGQGEIRRTETALAERLPPDVILAPLYGALDPAEQDRAIDPAPPGRRKVVLATSIAETSLTIEGVRVVVDSGLARVPAYDPASGLTRLETVRVSQAAADQRRGRAGRTQAGVCYRLWDEPETRALTPFARPEILESDLSGFALSLAQWGAKDPAALAFLDQPPSAAFAEARTLLERLEALDARGELTAHGKLLARLPLPPRLAHMVAVGAASGAAPRAAWIAAVLTERGLGGTSANLTDRLERFEADRGPRAKDARALADRWAKAAGGQGRGEAPSDGVLLAAAYPERLAKARGKPGEYRMASGRGVFVEPHEALAKEPWLAVAELGSGAARDRILLAAPIDQAEVEAAFAHQIETEDRLDPDSGGKFKARRIRKLGALILEERAIDRPDPALIAAALMNQVRREGLITLSFAESTTAFRQRIAFLRQSEPDAWPDLSDQALVDTLEDWLAPLLDGKTALSQVFPDALDGAIRALVPRDQQRALDRDAPPRFTAPTGNSFVIDYGAEGGPRVEVRVGELYGLAEHPCLGRARVAITLALLSPAHRPVQTTKDLPGFWRGSWKDVRTEMKGRYPRHVWPEDPAAAAPVTRAKPRGT
jgi:ATP-dependent helicase HrpB